MSPRSLFLLPACCALLLFCFGQEVEAADFRSGELLVELAPSIPVSVVVDQGVSNVETVRPGLVRVGLPAGVSVEEAMAAYSSRSGVVHVQPNYAYHIQTAPKDPDYSKQWGLRNTGVLDPALVTSSKAASVAGADISAEAAWDRVTGDPTVVVAIIDTGIDTSHPDLVDNLWTAADGSHGRNLLSTGPPDYAPRGDPGDIGDRNGHGTLVAGVIAAKGNNLLGTTGVAWRASLMALRACDENGLCFSSDIIKAIDFAIANGARIINASFGDTGSSDPADTVAFDRAEYEALQRARNAGILVAASACNNQRDNDADSRLTCVPASYDLDNIVAVAASDPADHLASFSNYGRTTVDLAAPGVAIWGPVPDWRRVGPSCSGGTNTADYSCTNIALPPEGVCRLAIENIPANETDRSIRVQWLQTARNIGIPSWNDLSTIKLIDQNLLGEAAVFADISILQSVGEPIDLRFTLPSAAGEAAYVECSGDHSSRLGEDFAQGTSLAAPFVSGVAVLLLADDPSQDYRSLRQRILNGVQALPTDAEKVASGGRLDAAGALGIASSPATVVGTSTGGGGGGDGLALIPLLLLTWFGRFRRIGYH